MRREPRAEAHLAAETAGVTMGGGREVVLDHICAFFSAPRQLRSTWSFSSARRHRRELCRHSRATSACGAHGHSHGEQRVASGARFEGTAAHLGAHEQVNHPPIAFPPQPGDRTGGRGRLHTRLKPPVKTEDWDLDVGWTKHT